MASQAFSLVRLRPLASTSSSRARSYCLASSLTRSEFISSLQIARRPSPSIRAFSQTTSIAKRPDPRADPNRVDYDSSYGDPWLPYRLRQAQPLFKPSPSPPPSETPKPERPKRLAGIRAYIRSRAPRTRTIIIASVLSALLFYWHSLEVVPVSGRKRFNCYSEKTVLEFSQLQYKTLLDDMAKRGETLLPAHDRRVRQVQRVMARLIPVAGMDGDWEVHVINNKSLSAANAFVLPGGKVFVFSGLMRIAQTDDQLAAVLSHEIAHNLAKHVSERLSASIGEQFFLGSILMLLAATPFTWIAGYYFGGTALSLLFGRPMSRMQESEADYIGLMMMAEACYDPREAVTFWARMDKLHREHGVEVPEWLSTHPTHGHRIERTTKWLPSALEKREGSDCVGTQGFAESFRRAMERSEVFSRGM